MKYRRRIFFTDKQKSQIWDRWQRGESMSSIGRLLGRDSSSIYPLLARTGGIRPPERRRSRLAMTLAEREEISRGLKAKLSFRSIARQLRRAPSTISREVRRAHLGLDCAERVGHPLRQTVRTRPVLFADDTPIKMQAKGMAQTAFLWSDV